MVVRALPWESATRQSALNLRTFELFDCQRACCCEADPAGIGPGTPEGIHSSLKEDRKVVELIGIEPTTSGLQSPRSPS
jgi:hypothetical protein